jgi:hypothetical protein
MSVSGPQGLGEWWFIGIFRNLVVLEFKLVGIGEAMGLFGQEGLWGIGVWSLGVVPVTTRGECTKPQVTMPSITVL